MDTKAEIKALETKLTPTDVKGTVLAMLNVMKIGHGDIEDRELMQDMFKLGMYHYMLLIEKAMKNVTKDKSANGNAVGPGTEDHIVGDTDQPDQVRE